MDSDDDFQLISSPEVDSPLVSGRKLKRLKKGSAVVESEGFPRIDDPFSSEALVEFTRIDDRRDGGFEMEELSAADLDDSDQVLQSGSGSKDLDDGGDFEPNLGLDGEESDFGVEKAVEFDAVAGNVGETEDRSLGVGEKGGDLVIDELEKKRPSLDAFEDEREAKRRKSKNKRRKSSGEPGDFNETAVSKRILEKERREYVEQLRAESQRLLRDTRGAAFKPMPFVHKPISSVLEKIRKRKLELSRKSINIENVIFDDDDNDDVYTEVVIKHRLSVEGKADSTEKECEDVDQRAADVENQNDSMCIDEQSNGTNMPSEMERVTDVVNEVFRAPVNDTQELFSNSQTNNGDDVSNEMSQNPLQENFTPSVLAMNLKHESTPLDDALNETSSSHLQENFTPSVLAMNLRLDSALDDDDDDSDDEEDNDKENVNPQPHGLSSLPSLASRDPVKAFVDEEAEEEDDSDHDMRFEDEEEDDNSDSEELQDMIATAYEENPIDNERRNELHQKWLEQQDVAGTEDLIQKLKYGSKFTKPALLEDENNEGENDFEFCEAAAEELLPLNVARMNIRKVKQMLPQMYTDKDDQYMSDGEETERRLTRERIFDKAEGKSTFLSPAEDESTREVFGLIKKLNVVPDLKKRPKAQSFLDPPLTGVGKNTSSKSSFLGRSSSLSLSSSHKHGSSTNSRSFIFGRDDSNSRGATMEESSDQGQSENKPTKISSAKFSCSQVRPSAQNTAPESKSGSSLLEILRQSSLQLQRKPCTFGEESSQMSSAFASFKLEKKHIKKTIKTEGRF